MDFLPAIPLNEIEPQLVFWPMFFLWLATTLLTDYFRESLPGQTPSGIGDFTIPTATEGRFVPLAFGTVLVQGPNVVWYGDFIVEERTVTTGLIFKRDEVIGYTYHLGLQMGIIRGRSTGMRRIWVGDDIVWDMNIDISPGGVPQTICDIVYDDLFGGKDEGGGIEGRIRLHTGEASQSVSEYLKWERSENAGFGSLFTPSPQFTFAERFTHLPAFRGFSYVTFSDLTETTGANIGESNIIRNFKFELQTINTIANGGEDSLGLANDHHIIGEDMNPIVLAYDVFTNTDWGRGFPPSDINLNNFRAAAEVIWGEGLGFSILIDQVQSASDLIDTIEQHVDGYIGPNPKTGQIEVNLARQDYVLASEYQADETNVISVSKFARGDYNQTFNEILVQYSDRAKYYDDTYAPAQDLANLIIQGRPRSKTVRMPGVHTAEIANKMAWRMLRGFSRPLASATVEVNRTGWDLRPGDVFSLTDAEIGVTNIAMRIIAMRQGDPISASVVLDCVEDVFGVEIVGFADPPLTEFIQPDADVQALVQAAQLAMEAPWILNRQDTFAPDLYRRLFISAAGGQPGFEFDVARRIATNSPISHSGSLTIVDQIGNGWATVGRLRNAETGWQDGNGTFTIDVDGMQGGNDLTLLPGNYAPGGEGQMTGVAVIDPGSSTEEWVAFDTITLISPEGIQLQNVFRSCMDSAMHPHASGAFVWFVWLGGAGMLEEQFVEGAGVDVKLLPRSQSNEISLLDSPEPESALPVVFGDDARALKPLIPFELKFDGDNFSSADQDYDLPRTPIDPDQFSPNSDYQGIQIVPTYRLFRVENIIWQVRGLNLSGGTLLDADVVFENMRVSWWLYDIDATPNPVRGVDEIDSAEDVVLNGVNDEIRLLRSVISAQRGAIIDPIEANTFNARIEIETSHQPDGFDESPNIFRASRDTMEFDFTAIGLFVIDPATIYMNVHFDGDEGSKEAIDVGQFQLQSYARGNAQIIRTESVFGGSSYEGVGSVAGSTGDRAHGFVFDRPNPVGSPTFDMGGNVDWTVECRLFFPTSMNAFDKVIFADYDGVSGNLGFFIWYDDSAGVFKITYSTTGSGVLSFTISDASPKWTETLDTWAAVAITQKHTGGGNKTWSAFVDGVFIGSISGVAGWNLPIDSKVGVGIQGWTGGNPGGTAGGIDAFRLTYGVALYAADYTIATADFPTSFDSTSLLASFDPRNAGALFEESIHRETVTFGGTSDIAPYSPFNTSPDGQGPFYSMRCDGFDSLTPALADGCWIGTTLGSPIFGAPTQFNLRANDFTMECWFMLDAEVDADGAALIAKYNRPSGNSIDWWWYISTNRASIVFGWSPLSSISSQVATVSPDFGSPSRISLNQWYHTAVTRVDDDIFMWLDGELIHHAPDFFAHVDAPNGNELRNKGTNPVTIGRFYDASVATRVRAMEGWIAEPRILNGTAEYTVADQSPFPSPYEPHLQSPVPTYTVPAAPFVKIPSYGLNAIEGPDSTHLKFLSHWSGTGSPLAGPIDESPDARTITVFGGASITEESPFASGFSLRCTNVGTSPVGGATIPDDIIWDIDSDDFTMDTFVRFNTVPSASPNEVATLIGQWSEQSSDLVWRFSYNGLTGLTFEQTTSGAIGTVQTASSPWSPDSSPETWYHVAVVRKDTVIYLFVDGVMIGAHGFRIASSPNSIPPVSFGTSFDASNEPMDGLDGWLAETRITLGFALWDRDFAPPTEEHLWHRTIFMPGPDRRVDRNSPMKDYSFLGESVATTDNAWFYMNNELKFPEPSPNELQHNRPYRQSNFWGSSGNGRVGFTYNAAQHLGAEEFTIETFAFFEDAPTGNTHELLGQWLTSGNDRSWGFRTGAGNVQFLWSPDGIVENIANFTAPSPFAINTWYHMAAVRDNSSSPELLRVFVDGIELVPNGSPELVNLSGVTLHDPTPAQIAMGAMGTGTTGEIDGRMEEPRVIKGKALYTSNFTPPTKRFERY